MKSARQLRKLTNDLQDIAMSLRMVPISGVFQKMNRIVRDMKQSLGKDVRLTIVGEDTEVDKTIVDNIQDPIMHIVRNSMDHGIEETAQERIAAGKEDVYKRQALYESTFERCVFVAVGSSLIIASTIFWIVASV